MINGSFLCNKVSKLACFQFDVNVLWLLYYMFKTKYASSRHKSRFGLEAASLIYFMMNVQILMYSTVYSDVKLNLD